MRQGFGPAPWWLALAGLLLLPTCSSAPRWPGVHFAEVRGYVFNLSDDADVYLHHEAVVVDGHLDETVIDREGVVLNDAQTTRLLGAIDPPITSGMVYLSMIHTRHAFVFYDEQHRPVAWFAICFHCSQDLADPEFAGFPDYDALRQLCVELGLPVFDDEGKYAALQAQAPESTIER